MGTVSIRELNQHTSACIRRVKAGETLDITDNGTLVARVVPVDSGEDVLAQLVAQGRAKPATADRQRLLDWLDRRFATEPIDHGAKASKALEELREERLP
ncbi:type II toxin-antitoxin system Phd/YefM family antitoxin [Planotetraspora sp. GP83]|uniref:type II toxin-antitoxin system Phd/YefM family antitoxin n=1 Tax=Planotetraspora sp. GP83 TaxID=3156264 RepID=UPI003513AA53